MADFTTMKEMIPTAKFAVLEGTHKAMSILFLYRGWTQAAGHCKTLVKIIKPAYTVWFSLN